MWQVNKFLVLVINIQNERVIKIWFRDRVKVEFNIKVVQVLN